MFNQIPIEKDPESNRVIADCAQEYVDAGLFIFPVQGVRDDKCTCHDPACTNPGKHPRTSHGYKDASNNPDQVDQWWREHPDSNIGLPTGRINGVVVIDIDPRNGGLESLAELERECGPLQVTAVQETGGGGLHLFFRYPENTEIPTINNFRPGIDVKSDGGYVILAPSRHASGKCYRWLETPHD